MQTVSEWSHPPDLQAHKDTVLCHKLLSPRLGSKASSSPWEMIDRERPAELRLFGIS